MLKARYYNFAPLLFGGNYYILVIFAKNMHQKTVYFRAPDAKFLLPWERRHPSQILPLSVASIPRSSPRRSAHPDFRIPRKISSYGPAYTCLQIICYVSRCSVLNSRRTSHLSVVHPSPLSFFLPLMLGSHCRAICYKRPDWPFVADRRNVLNRPKFYYDQHDCHD